MMVRYGTIALVWLWYDGLMGKLQDCLTLISGSPSYTTPPIVSVQFQFHASTSFTFLVQQISCRLDLIPLSWKRVCFLLLVKFFFSFPEFAYEIKRDDRKF